MNLLKISQTKLILLFIVAFALMLRVVNLTVGFPGLYVSNDEAILHLSALNMIANKTIFSLSNYGPLGSYVQLPLLAIGILTLFLSGKIHSTRDLDLLLSTQEGYFIFVPRIISALFGVLCVLSIYRVSYVVTKNKQASLWAAFFTAVSFNLVHISHLARAFSPAIFFAILTVLFFFHSQIDNKSKFKNITLSFFYSAVAFGFHQIVGIVAIFPFLTLLSSRLLKITLKEKFISVSVWFITILLLNFLGLGDKFFEIFRSNNSLSVTLIKTPNFWLSKSFSASISIILDNVKIYWELILTDGLILLFAIWGFLKAKFSRSVNGIFISYAMLGFVLSTFVFPPILRYFLQVIVFLPVFAGITAYSLLKGKSILLSLLIIFLASFNSIYWNGLITKEATFGEMRKWVDATIPAQTPIAVTFYRTVGYTPSKKAAEIIREFKPGYYLRMSNLLTYSDYPYNVRNIVYLENFGKNSKLENLYAGLEVFPAKYVIDAYFKDSERLLNMTDNLELVAHFSPTGDVISKERIPEAFADAPENLPLFKTDRPGIYFDILRIK